MSFEESRRGIQERQTEGVEKSLALYLGSKFWSVQRCTDFPKRKAPSFLRNSQPDEAPFKEGSTATTTREVSLTESTIPTLAHPGPGPCTQPQKSRPRARKQWERNIQTTPEAMPAWATLGSSVPLKSLKILHELEASVNF